MDKHKNVIKIVANLVAFCISIFLIIMGQKNSGLVNKIAVKLNVEIIGYVGLAMMLVGLSILLIQLYNYNKHYR